MKNYIIPKLIVLSLLFIVFNTNEVKATGWELYESYHYINTNDELIIGYNAFFAGIFVGWWEHNTVTDTWQFVTNTVKQIFSDKISNEESKLKISIEQNKITLNGSPEIADMKILVSDLSGKVLLNKTNPDFDGEESYSVEEFNGILLIYVETENFIHSQKIFQLK